MKKKGKKPNVIDRNIKTLQHFIDFLSKRDVLIEEVTIEMIQSYVERLENDKISAKGYLYTLMNYFRFANQPELLECCRGLREQRTKRSRQIFQLKDFLDIDKDLVSKLNKIGIKNVNQMLDAGKTPDQRIKLANRLKVDTEEILELVQLSDITRTGYVKKKLARLYYNAGITSPQILASYNPQDLQDHFAAYVKKSDWKGQIPFLADLTHNIENAKKLEKVVIL